MDIESNAIYGVRRWRSEDPIEVEMDMISEGGKNIT
jgi:hypothetical protein